MTTACPAPVSLTETHGPHCGQLHCAVCTAHLANPQQRFCSPLCRSRARSLRKVMFYCANCGARRWLPHRPLKSGL